MAKLSADTLMERETTLRYDESDDLAWLFTASIPVRNEWQSLGYVAQPGISRGTWTLRVNKDRIVLKPAKRRG